MDAVTPAGAEKVHRLFAQANAQAGYFTAKQAEHAGYSRRMQHYHLSTGRWERAVRGVYRLRDYPSTQDAQYAELTLWSRNLSDQPQATLGFETALRLHDLSDLDPATIHLIVPPGFRKAAPPGVRLHRAGLTPGDVQHRGSYHVTTPLRTLLDVAREGTLSPEHFQAAVRDALDQGLVRRGKLRDAFQHTAVTPSLRDIAAAVLERP